MPGSGDIEFRVTYGKRSFDDAAAGVLALVRDLRGSWEGEYSVVKGLLKDYLEHVADTLARNSFTAYPNVGGDKLASRTDTALDSIYRSIKVAGTAWSRLNASIGGVSYLAIHEYGGTVSGRGKLLTIPLPAALSSRGTTQPFPRKYGNTFVARSKKGNLIIFQKRGSSIVPLYLLVPSVAIKPRLHMADTLNKEMPYFTEKVLDQVARDITGRLGA